MSCSSCNQAPCGCQPAVDPCQPELCFIDPCQAVNPEPNCSTKCNLDTRDNIWYVSDQPGYDCKCKLDQMTYGQVIDVLEHVPYSARALMRITDDPCLLLLARTIKLILPEQEDNAIAANRINKNTLPYYTLFRGNTGGDPGHGKVRKTRSG